MKSSHLAAVELSLDAQLLTGCLWQHQLRAAPGRGRHTVAAFPTERCAASQRNVNFQESSGNRERRLISLQNVACGRTRATIRSFLEKDSTRANIRSLLEKDSTRATIRSFLA